MTVLHGVFLVDFLVSHLMTFYSSVLSLAFRVACVGMASVAT